MFAQRTTNTPLMIASYKGHLDVVSYLVERGANTELQDNNGDTCLHFAARWGNVEVVGKLLALGAKQKRNLKGLTPLLETSTDCKVEMVEHFIIQPECTKEQRIDALELLGATIANDRATQNIEKAFGYMERGMKMRYEDHAHPLLKMETKPVKAYQNRRESQTLEELDLLKGDDHAVRMEGLLIRERILGTENTMLLDNIRYSGSVFAESQQFEVCIGLWIRGMELAINGDIPVAEDVGKCTNLFVEMVQGGHPLGSKIIEEVIEKLVDANEKLFDANEKLSGKLRSGKSQKSHEKEEQETLLFYALDLLMIYIKVKDPLEMKNSAITICLQRFLRLNPRTRDGNTLLHLAVRQATPSVALIKVILLGGSDVNVVNEEGNTPLHFAVTLKPEPEEMETLKEILELFLVNGAFTKLVNTNYLSAMDCCETMDARMILLGKSRQNAMEVNANDEVTGSDVTKERGGKSVFVTERTLRENSEIESSAKEISGKLREVTQELENVQHQLRKKERQLRKRGGELMEKMQLLTLLQEGLKERDGQLTESHGRLRKMGKDLTYVRRKLQEKNEEVSHLGGRLTAKQHEIDQLEASCSEFQRALHLERSRHQNPDWVISRDQIQLTDKCLGKGGWGTVVEGKYCGCAVAVKQMHDAILSDYNRGLFKREMNIAARCRHPCLLQFIGATNDEGNPLFVTELMKSSLRALLKQRSLQSAEVFVISLDVARALNYLHEKRPSPIIHRDISSANVLLWREDHQWRGKVSDYGTANFKEDSMTACPGSRIYSAPEALTETQTVKLDVYSFGVLLCEICIREQPEPERRSEQVAMVNNRELQALIRRCLSRTPEKRPSMEDIIGYLEQRMLNWF
ncbi:protein fem-1 homolog B-like [Stylophora pistillata]|uniref:protein fem-1 homolog B-like n=1 Tax=Stylophora pistillata TaxID=50429 RepID=UPI000C043504|nr:protein fem-1 homolog B-like [Stylophora pistillata]